MEQKVVEVNCMLAAGPKMYVIACQRDFCILGWFFKPQGTVIQHSLVHIKVKKGSLVQQNLGKV